MEIRGSRVKKKKTWKNVIVHTRHSVRFHRITPAYVRQFMLLLSALRSIQWSFILPPSNNPRAAVEGRVPCLHGLRAAKTSLPKRAALRQHLDAVKRGSQLYFQMFTANSLGLQKRNQTNKSPLNKQPTTVLILNQLRSTQLGCSKKDLFYSPTFFCIICQHTRTGSFLTYF